MALKFDPRLRRPPKRAWRWKRWSPLPPQPSRSTTCVKPSTKGWRLRTSFSSKRQAGRAATFCVWAMERATARSESGAVRGERNRRKIGKAAAGGGQPAGSGLDRERDGAVLRSGDGGGRRGRFVESRGHAAGRDSLRLQD